MAHRHCRRLCERFLGGRRKVGEHDKNCVCVLPVLQREAHGDAEVKRSRKGPSGGYPRGLFRKWQPKKQYKNANWYTLSYRVSPISDCF